MNDTLAKTEAALRQKINPKLVPVVDKVVESGKRVMYDPKTRDMAMQQLKGASDPESIGSAVAKLAAVLMNQAKGVIPPEVLFPASMLLLMEALGFLEEAGAVQATPDFVAQCAQALGSAYLQALGVTPEKLQSMMGGQAGPPSGSPAAAPPAGIVGGAAAGGA